MSEPRARTDRPRRHDPGHVERALSLNRPPGKTQIIHRLAASFSRSLQARLVGGTVKVSGSPPASWHHLHKGEQPAFKNNFVALQVRVPVPQRGECGPIRFSRTGQMLGGGQVVGAEVAWNYPGLDDHAQVTCSPAACQRTNAQGFAYLEVLPKVEPGPGGIGPEFAGRVTVTAEVNLFQALGPELHSVLNLPPDMRILARKQMPSDVTWHRGYKVELDIESVLRVIDNTYQLGNHVGNAKLTGMLDVATVHASGRQPSEQPIIGVLSTQTTGGQANCGPNRRGSYTAKTHNDTIDMQAIEAVIYPPEKLSLYLDVGPADDYSDETYRLILCDPRTGAVGDDYSTSGTNLWESTILYGYPRGLSLEGLGGDKWQAVATQQDWEGSSRFRVATWATGQSCGGFCTPNLSSLTISIYATPLPDP